MRLCIEITKSKMSCIGCH